MEEISREIEDVQSEKYCKKRGCLSVCVTVVTLL